MPNRHSKPATTHQPGQAMQSNMHPSNPVQPMNPTHPSDLSDFMGLDDPQFLSARARLRQRLEDLPERHADRAELRRTYDAMTREFDCRASRAWTQVG